jgi:hypothetical protein
MYNNNHVEAVMGHYPSPAEHEALTGRGLEIQTDKEKFKIVPCTYAGCTVDLIVNTFYAPAKGKCSLHSGKTQNASAAASLVHSSEATPAKPNGNLAQLLCPLCGMPMLVLRIDESNGWITFRCADGFGSKVADIGYEACGTSVTVKPDSAWAESKGIPSRFAALIEDLNLTQKIEYFDAKEARDVARTPQGAVGGGSDS